MHINELKERAFDQAADKGFHENQPHRVNFVDGTNGDIAYAQAVKDYHGNKFMLIVGEVNEAHDELRDGRGITETYYNPEKPDKPEGIPSEMADIVIRVADYCGANGIDLEEIIAIKMAYNAGRPRLHGREF